MSDTVTFGNVQVPTADVLAAADRIRAAGGGGLTMPTAAPVEGMEYRSTDPGLRDYLLRYADGQWQWKSSVVDWSGADNPLYSRWFSLGDLIPAHEPVVGQCYRWHANSDEEPRKDGMSLLRFTETGWRVVLRDREVNSVHADEWLTHQVRMKLRVPCNPPPSKAAWVPKVGEWVTHITGFWTNKVEHVVGDIAIVSFGGNVVDSRDQFHTSSIRPATPAEIEAATTFKVKVGMVLRRKVDGAVLRTYSVEPCGAWAGRLDAPMRVDELVSPRRLPRADYDILPSYTVEGVTE